MSSDGSRLVDKFAPTGRSGYAVADLDTGEVLEGFFAEQGFAPASVAKIPTALYALDLLGVEHRFETRLLVTGQKTGEVLDGDLILQGGGDPELDSDDLLPLLTTGLETGIRLVNGRFLVDGALGPRRPHIDADQPVDAAYNPSLSGLNLNFNRVRVKWIAKGVDREIRVSAKAQRLDPDVARVRVEIAEERPALVFRHELDGETEIWRVARGALRRPGARWLPVRLPELYAGDVFRGLAATYGLNLRAPVMSDSQVEGRLIAQHESRALRHIVRDMLRYSTNITAEAIGVAASEKTDAPVSFSRQVVEQGGTGPNAKVSAAVSSAARASARPATLEASADRMNAWAATFAGFPIGDPAFQLRNHSGLTTESRVSPIRMIELLRVASRVAAPDGRVHDRVPGQIAGLLRDYNIAAKTVKLDYKNIDILAKTGTMDFVRGLAGYAVTPKGRRLVFAIFSNDLPRRGEASRRTQRYWTARAKTFERALLRDWMVRYDTAS